MTINPDLERELALVVERESLAVAVRVLGLLYAEVVRLDQQLTQTDANLVGLVAHLEPVLDKVVGGLDRSLAIDRDILTAISTIRADLDCLGVMHKDARPGHGYATMAGEHSAPSERAKE